MARKNYNSSLKLVVHRRDSKYSGIKYRAIKEKEEIKIIDEEVERGPLEKKIEINLEKISKHM